MSIRIIMLGMASSLVLAACQTAALDDPDPAATLTGAEKTETADAREDTVFRPEQRVIDDGDSCPVPDYAQERPGIAYSSRSAAPLASPPPSPPPPPPPPAPPPPPPVQAEQAELAPSPSMQQIIVTGSQTNANGQAQTLNRIAVDEADFVDRERYPDSAPNPVNLVSENPVSTFSIDVDTAAYANVRRMLNRRQLPPSDAVRIEELINYFDYGYDAPETGEHPFATSVTVTPSPWAKGRDLIHIGIQGRDLPKGDRPPMNLTLLMDVSGSMSSSDKLPLAKQALNKLIPQLTREDTISMVVYAGAAGQVLEPTSGFEPKKIRCALENLRAGGSTAGGAGLTLAYQLAEQNFRDDGVNRVMILTDGDFNVGVVQDDKLEDFVARKRKTGIYLSVMGFGQGNYNDALMQTLAQAGNGIAGYVDTEAEAEKLFRDDLAGNMFPIADDVKIQIEFNPAQVAEYRLIGYETRLLAREDFNNDAVDAGDIGAGANVTALYEIVRTGSDARLVDESRYSPTQKPPAGASRELAFLKLRYKAPGAEESVLVTRPITPDDIVDQVEDASTSTRFATAVAAFGQALRNDPYLAPGYGWDEIRELANGALGADPYGYRAGFVKLVDLADEIEGGYK